jgi:hypothetical protein
MKTPCLGTRAWAAFFGEQHKNAVQSRVRKWYCVLSRVLLLEKFWSVRDEER